MMKSLDEKADRGVATEGLLCFTNISSNVKQFAESGKN